MKPLPEQGRGFDALVLPLMILAGSVGLACFLAWFVFVVMYMVFLLGLSVALFSDVLRLFLCVT